MKKCINKLLYSSLIAFMMSIGYFDAEARVTKEVAEAVLPYLMKAAGIPEDVRSNPDPNPNVPYYTQAKRDAIISMIYTDEGQQQMVKWVNNGEFPQNLTNAGFISTNTYTDKAYRDISLASLFPCQTDTFTSFANHESRLGKHVLSSTAKTIDMLAVLISSKTHNKTATFDEILHNINICQKNSGLDIKLSKIIFILDICDTADQITNTIKKTGEKIPNLKYNNSLSEYKCRPVSAILTNNSGDCVETLYRHIINIAIQDRENKLQIGRLPVPLRKYYDPKLQATEILVSSNTHAGLTSIEKHEKWNQCLMEISSGVIDCSVGSLYNLAKMLDYIANYDECRVINNTKASEKQALCDLLITAMNKLNGNKHPDKGPQRFEGTYSENENKSKWYNVIITIEDKLIKRKIQIGICEKTEKDYGHAEILSINPFE